MTIATFADPALGAGTPLFTVTGGSLTGEWTGSGLTFLTPGLTAPDFPNAHFTMASVTAAADGTTGPGTIQFTDNANNPIMTISFNSGRLTTPLGFGATEFMSINTVTFSGPIVTMPLITESFSFGFANQAAIANGYTATASFTSSAIPEPMSLLLLALGGTALIRRRLA